MRLLSPRTGAQSPPHFPFAPPSTAPVPGTAPPHSPKPQAQSPPPAPALPSLAPKLLACVGFATKANLKVRRSWKLHCSERIVGIHAVIQQKKAMRAATVAYKQTGKMINALTPIKGRFSHQTSLEPCKRRRTAWLDHALNTNVKITGGSGKQSSANQKLLLLQSLLIILNTGSQATPRKTGIRTHRARSRKCELLKNKEIPAMNARSQTNPMRPKSISTTGVAGPKCGIMAS